METHTKGGGTIRRLVIRNRYYTEKGEGIHREEIQHGKRAYYGKKTHMERGHITEMGHTTERGHT